MSQNGHHDNSLCIRCKKPHRVPGNNPVTCSKCFASDVIIPCFKCGREYRPLIESPRCNCSAE